MKHVLSYKFRPLLPAGLPESTTQAANRSVQPFLHSSRQKVPKLYNERLFLQNCPFPWGDLDPHLTHDSLGSSEPITQTASRSVQTFLTAQCPYTLQWDAPSPPPSKLPFPWGSGPPSNTWPTRVLNPNGISISSAVFAGLTSVTDRPTDRQTDHVTRSVTIGRICVHSTAMWRNNSNDDDNDMRSYGCPLLKPNSITLASSELAPNMFGASSELVRS